MRVSPGMRFLGPAPGRRRLGSSHIGVKEQEGPHESLPGHPPGFCSLWVRVAVSTRSAGTNG